jgi:acetyl-CoA carboxylase beta subunit
VDVKNDTTVHVSIPKPKILDTVIDEKSIEVFNESQNAFNPIKISDYNDALSREKSVMIRDAMKQGIYMEATRQAKMAITTLLNEMGFTQIHITEEFIIPQPH